MARCVEQTLVNFITGFLFGLRIDHREAARLIRGKTHLLCRCKIIEVESFADAGIRKVQTPTNTGVVHADFRISAGYFGQVRKRFDLPCCIQVVQHRNFSLRKSVDVEVEFVDIHFGGCILVLTAVRYSLVQ